jgi:hypothetical protein
MVRIFAIKVEEQVGQFLKIRCHRDKKDFEFYSDSSGK